MSGVTDTATITTGSWRELLGPKNLGASTVLAGGVALYATNEFLTISLMPSAVADIGGQRFYAWVTTVYLVASVVAATTVHATADAVGAAVVIPVGPQRVRRRQPGVRVWRRPWRCCWWAARFRARPVVCWPVWATRSSTPHCRVSLWTKASALVSAMWGVGTLVGPAAGGLFSQFSSWRWAFGVLVILTARDDRSRPDRAAGAPRNRRRRHRAHGYPGVVATAVGCGGAGGQRGRNSARRPGDGRAAGARCCAGRRLRVRRSSSSAAVLPPSTFGPGP